MRRHLQNPRILAFGICALFIAACEKKEEVKTVAPPDVLITEAASRDVPVYREWIGTLNGSENAEIRARVTGHLIKRNYQEGAAVKKGDLLFEIDPRPFEAALAQAKSSLQQGKAVQLASQAEAERSTELFGKKVISEKEFTNKTQLNESNVAKVKALEAEVEQAQLNLEFCRITSPVDGIAGIAQAQVGDLVGTGSSATLTQVSTVDPMKISFPVSESDYLAASKGLQDSLSKPLDQREERMQVVLADGSIFEHKARLLSVDREVKASTGTILVTALLKNPGGILRPGFFARARIEAQVLKDAVVVPERAVYEVQGSFQVGVVGADGKAEIRPVKMGTRSNGDWVVTSGLKAGEKVIVEGLQKVKSGAPVNAKPWSREKPEAAKAAPTGEAAPKAESH